MTDSFVSDEPIVVAIDGPAGSGKSSVSKEVATRLRYGYLDTGAVYRALAWSIVSEGEDTTQSAAALLDAYAGFETSISLDPERFAIEVRGEDVTEAIREPRITAAVGPIARVPGIREGLNGLFRSLIATANRPGVVVEGRDITTVVAPDAPVRVLLTASPEVRAARRSAELESTGRESGTVAEAMRRRDASDSTVVDFMTPADGVRVVDSTDLDFEQTVAAVLEVIDEKMGAHNGR